MSTNPVVNRPSLIDGIKIEDILAPKPVLGDYNGHKIPFYPMSDNTLMRVSEDMENIFTVLKDTLDFSKDNLFNETTLMSVLPTVVKHLLPSVTTVIAASLGVDEEVVGQVAIADKVNLLAMVFKAERIEEVAKNGKGLLSTFGSTAVTPNQMEDEAPMESSEQTEGTPENLEVASEVQTEP